MTVCIAAMCKDSGSSRFVLCSDRRIETVESGGDVCVKFDHAGDGWMALIAGDTARVRDLAGVFREAMAEKTEKMTAHQISNLLTACAHQQKKNLAEHFVQSQLAVSYDYLLKNGKVKLPPEEFSQLIASVRLIDLGCELILSGFVEENPVLFKVQRDGSVNRMDAFAVIGAGEAVAEASLFRRKCVGTMSVEEVAYYVYEAKRMSEVASSVGPATSLAVMRRSGPGFSQFRMIDDFTMATLDAHYKQIGPQEYKPYATLLVPFGFSLPEGRPDLRQTKADQLPQLPSPESPGESDES